MAGRQRRQKKAESASAQDASKPAEKEQSPTEAWLDKFERRTVRTYLSRARAATRLATRDRLWMIALSLCSAGTLCASVVSLASPVTTPTVDLAAVVLSLATLVLSLIVTALNYAGRSRDFFHGFRAVQKVAAQLELRKLNADVTSEEARSALAAMEAKYQEALDQSENHSSLDFYRSRPIREDHSKWDSCVRAVAVIVDSTVTLIPIFVLLAISALFYWLVTSDLMLAVS